MHHTHAITVILGIAAAVMPIASASASELAEGSAPGLTIGIGAGASLDLPDRASGEHTRLGPGAGVQVPVRWSLGSHAAVRANARLDFGGTGTDRVSWVHPVDGEFVRFHDQDHWALLLAAGLTVGPELTVPVRGPLQPYVGVGAGLTWLGTYHSLGDETAHLLDPAQNDLQDPRNVDPYTSQLAVLTEVGLGVRTTGATRLWCELGYSNAWVEARPLARTPPALEARREAYGWNAARLAAGVSWAL